MTKRELVYNKFSGHCAYCGQKITIKQMQMDHVAPIFRGWDNKPDRAGKDDVDNLFPACASCNHRKSTLTVEQFRAELEQAVPRLLRDSATFRNAVRFGLVEIKNIKIKFYFEDYLLKKKIMTQQQEQSICSICSKLCTYYLYVFTRGHEREKYLDERCDKLKRMEEKK